MSEKMGTLLNNQFVIPNWFTVLEVTTKSWLMVSLVEAGHVSQLLWQPYKFSHWVKIYHKKLQLNWFSGLEVIAMS